jgi:hypothetical protein
MKTTKVLLIALVLAGLYGLGKHVIDKHHADPRQQPEMRVGTWKKPEPVPARDYSAVLGELALLSVRSEHEAREILRGTESALDEIRREHLARAGKAARLSAQPLQGFNNISLCVWLGARDMMSGTQRLPRYINKACLPAVVLVSECHAKQAAEMEACEVALRSLVNRHRAATLQLLKEHDVPEGELAMPDFKKLQSVYADAVKSYSNAALSGLIEVALLKFTYRTAFTILRPIIARQAAALTASGVAVVADGPIPIGDAVGGVILVGGTVATAWEIRKAVKRCRELPHEVEGAIVSTLEQMTATSRRNLRTAGKNIGFPVPEASGLAQIRP